MSPAFTASTPAGTIASPLARATVANRFGWREPVDAATHRSPSHRHRTRANIVFPSGPRSSVSRSACTSGRAAGRPISVRIAGRTKASNDTNTETGLPGRPK